MENSQEKPQGEPQQKFEDVVPLREPMSVSEAIDVIANFHDTETEAIRAAFFNLREANETDLIKFDNSVSNGRPCLKIEVSNSEGEVTAFSLIDSSTGQPIAHIS